MTFDRRYASTMAAAAALMTGGKTLGQMVETASKIAIGRRIGYKAAVRRMVGTSDWQHDPERKAAAEAKREKRRARNLKNLAR